MDNDLTIPTWLAPTLADLLAPGGRIPHAMLLHGQAGLGKRLLGEALARGLLCESADPAMRAQGGCGRCAACGWFEQRSHPDFRVVTSEALAAAEGLSADAVDSDVDEVPAGAGRPKRAPSREIKVDQTRTLHGFLSVATHRGRARVVLLDPLDAVNDIAANALLKMLEEPPPATVFILIGEHLGRVPATIVSRCRKVFVATPSTAVAREWLAARGMADSTESLALAGGAPLAALALAGDVEAMRSHRALIAFLVAPGIDAALATAEGFGKGSAAAIVRWMQQWVADCVAAKLAGSIRYHPAQSQVIERLAATAPIDHLMALMQRLNAIRRSIDHPLNTRLVLESLLMAYCDAVLPAGVSVWMHGDFDATPRPTRRG